MEFSYGHQHVAKKLKTSSRKDQRGGASYRHQPSLPSQWNMVSTATNVNHTYPHRILPAVRQHFSYRPSSVAAAAATAAANVSSRTNDNESVPSVTFVTKSANPQRVPLTRPSPPTCLPLFRPLPHLTVESQSQTTISKKHNDTTHRRSLTLPTFQPLPPLEAETAAMKAGSNRNRNDTVVEGGGTPESEVRDTVHPLDTFDLYEEFLDPNFDLFQEPEEEEGKDDD